MIFLCFMLIILPSEGWATWSHGEEGMETNVNSTYPIIPKHYLQVSNEKAD